MGKVKDILRKAARDGLWMALSLLPKDENKAVCQSYYGRGYSDSPKAIADELLARGGWKVYWTGEGGGRGRHAALRALRASGAATAPGRQSTTCAPPGCGWTTPASGAYTLEAPRHTCYVQTWHGFPLKRIEGDAADALPQDYLQAAQQDSQHGGPAFVQQPFFDRRCTAVAFGTRGRCWRRVSPATTFCPSPHPELEEKVRQSLGPAGGEAAAAVRPHLPQGPGAGGLRHGLRPVRPGLGAAASAGSGWCWQSSTPTSRRRPAQLHLDPRWSGDASGYPDIQELYLACGAADHGLLLGDV